MFTIYTSKSHHVYCCVNQTLPIALIEILKLNFTNDCLK